jgi:hypothetical protein
VSRDAHPLAWRRIAAWAVDWLIISAYAVALVPVGLLLVGWQRGALRFPLVQGFPAGRLRRAGQQWRPLAHGLSDGVSGGHRDLLSVVAESQRGVRLVAQRVGCPARLDIDFQP